MTGDGAPGDSGRLVVFGEVLFDVFPDGRKVAGGAPYNVARHLGALGLDPLFVSRVGDDALGRAILDEMDALGMDRGGVAVDAKRPTGVVDVRMVDGEPEYDIVRDVAWDHIDHPGATACGILYHGSLAVRSSVSAASLARFAGADRFVDLNLRPPWYTEAAVKACVDRAHTLKVNGGEMRELCAMLGIRARGEADAAARVVEEAALQMLYVTEGERGALGMARGERPVRVPAAPAGELVDTVGAGDAFSSVCLCAQALGWDLPTTLERASALAAGVCGLRGAFPASEEFHAGYIKDWGLEPCR